MASLTNPHLQAPRGSSGLVFSLYILTFLMVGHLVPRVSHSAVCLALSRLLGHQPPIMGLSGVPSRLTCRKVLGRVQLCSLLGYACVKIYYSFQG